MVGREPQLLLGLEISPAGVPVMKGLEFPSDHPPRVVLDIGVARLGDPLARFPVQRERGQGVAPGPVVRGGVVPLDRGVQLDAVDRQLVEALLAACVNVSRATAYQRLGRLRSAGVIRRFTVEVDSRKLGLPIAALVLVSVVQHAWREVGERLRRLPGVEWLALSTGSFDYVLLVRAPDVDHLRDVILDGLQSIPEIQSSQTLVLLDEPTVE